MVPSRALLAMTFILAGTTLALADGIQDNIPTKVRPVPPPGVAVPDEDRKAIETSLGDLDAQIQKLLASKDPKLKDLVCDVQIFHKAAHDALKYQEFFKPQEIARAKALLEEGRRRADQLLLGTAPWTTKTGLVVRGYVSKIDGSVQPYGLVIPETYKFAAEVPTRLDVWLHGRGEVLSEVNFLDDHQKNKGIFTPAKTIVLHPYGRYNNAFKFAGEVDVLEAIDSVRRNYQIDDDRIGMRGFSMGGAGCWQFAVHYPDRWFAAAPGAGFSETPLFLKVFQRETLQPTWYEKTLWKLYDCPEFAANIRSLPTIAYSGERDNQKQAADVMVEALRKEGIDLLHLIGPGKGHEYHPDSKVEIDRRIDSLAEVGRRKFPLDLAFATTTLKYNRIHWLTVDALQEHWKSTRVRAFVVANGVVIKTENVQALTLDFPPGRSPFPVDVPVAIEVDGIKLDGHRPFSDHSWKLQLHRAGSTWAIGPDGSEGLRKKHDLQGPVDDAFMDSFVFVTPTGAGKHPRVNAWVESESKRAISEWRRQFRGEARVKADKDVTDADIASSNLALWGDPESNAVLKKIADKLPISWDQESIKVGDKSFPADTHALIQIYPNPLNPSKYVVLNSGFTHREYDYLNNARQVPKLPDWAIIDVQTPPNPRFPGAVVDADFFGERWELRPPTQGR